MKAKSLDQASGIEQLDGVVRKTLSYNEEVMLCHFQLNEGARIPLHDHRASQIGFVVKGAVRFQRMRIPSRPGPGTLMSWTLTRSTALRHWKLPNS